MHTDIAQPYTNLGHIARIAAMLSTDKFRKVVVKYTVVHCRVNEVISYFNTYAESNVCMIFF